MSRLIKNSSMNYYNIDSILEDEEYVKITFNDFIRGSKLFKSAKSGQKIDLPLFAVKFLLQNDHCKMAEEFDEKLKNDLEADSSIVDLKKTHFYTYSNFLLFNINEFNMEVFSEEIPKNLLDRLFLERMGSFTKILVKEDFSEDDVSHMSYEERRIAVEGRKKYQLFNKYQRN
ncbi:hypothetical protein NUSPORA_01460 [Nucleospora cyclopteri]